MLANRYGIKRLEWVFVRALFLLFLWLLGASASPVLVALDAIDLCQTLPIAPVEAVELCPRPLLFMQ